MNEEAGDFENRVKEKVRKEWDKELSLEIFAHKRKRERVWGREKDGKEGEKKRKPYKFRVERTRAELQLFFFSSPGRKRNSFLGENKQLQL